MEFHIETSSIEFVTAGMSNSTKHVPP